MREGGRRKVKKGREEEKNKESKVKEDEAREEGW